VKERFESSEAEYCCQVGARGAFRELGESMESRFRGRSGGTIKTVVSSISMDLRIWAKGWRGKVGEWGVVKIQTNGRKIICSRKELVRAITVEDGGEHRGEKGKGKWERGRRKKRSLDETQRKKNPEGLKETVR